MIPMQKWHLKGFGTKSQCQYDVFSTLCKNDIWKDLEPNLSVNMMYFQHCINIVVVVFVPNLIAFGNYIGNAMTQVLRSFELWYLLKI